MVSVFNGSLYSQINLIDSLKHALKNVTYNEELKKLETELTPSLKTYYLKHHSYEKKELAMKAEQDKKDVISKQNLKQKKNNEIILLTVLQQLYYLNSLF